MSEETVFGLPAKYLALCALVIQNSALILTMRYSRVNASPTDQYLTSTAVVLSEAIKSCFCFILHLRERQHQIGSNITQGITASANGETPSTSGVTELIRKLFWEVYSSESGFVKMIFPAALYTLQDNLQFIAASNLDPATHQVTYQGKILTTALFAVVLLKKRLSSLKWLALLLLTLGVAAVQIPAHKPSPATEENSHGSHGSQMVGFAAVSCACITSGLAGVYFEKVLKGGANQQNPSSNSNKTFPSLWTRSLQLSTASFVFAICHAIIHDGSAIREQGFLHGYNLRANPTSIAAVFMQATCGLIVAMVIKYADNILKGFATSMSVVLSTIASVWLFGFIITQYFLGGAALVLLATWMYGLPDGSKHRISGEAEVTRSSSDEEKANEEQIELSSRESASVFMMKEMPMEQRQSLIGLQERSENAEDWFNGQDLLY